MDKQAVTYKDLGKVSYKQAWDYQEDLLQLNVKAKSLLMNYKKAITETDTNTNQSKEENLFTPTLCDLSAGDTKNYFLLCEHPPVYTLGKSGDKSNILISELEMEKSKIEFYQTNRGGDITFHGPEQVVGYPILDLEKFYTDIGRYLRELEEVIILTIAEYGIMGNRSKGETGVWIDADKPGRERKICAIGVRCSRWITMHGFALNVNTDLSYFDNIIPCGIFNKQVTSIEKELNSKVDITEVKEKLCRNFEQVFNARLSR